MLALLNKLRKFNLREIRIEDDELYFSVNLAYKSAVCQVLGKNKYFIIENNNIFRSLNFFYTRSVFAITAAACVAAFIMLEQFVFKVKVEGLTGDEHKQIVRYLETNGIKKFSQKRSQNTFEVAQDIVNEFDFIAAANVQVRGATLIYIFLRADNVISQIPNKDIITAHDGVIADIIVFSGTALVSAGDVVHAGDVLVTGTRPTAIIHISNGKEVVCIINNSVIK